MRLTRMWLRRPGLAHPVLLEVSDTRTGISAATRLRCVEPFFSTKGALSSGLRLAMVYGIIQRHNGILAVESSPGQGTTLQALRQARGAVTHT